MGVSGSPGATVVAAASAALAARPGGLAQTEAARWATHHCCGRRGRARGRGGEAGGVAFSRSACNSWAWLRGGRRGLAAAACEGGEQPAAVPVVHLIIDY